MPHQIAVHRLLPTPSSRGINIRNTKAHPQPRHTSPLSPETSASWKSPQWEHETGYRTDLSCEILVWPRNSSANVLLKNTTRRKVSATENVELSSKAYQSFSSSSSTASKTAPNETNFAEPSEDEDDDGALNRHLFDEVTAFITFISKRRALLLWQPHPRRRPPPLDLSSPAWSETT